MGTISIPQTLAADRHRATEMIPAAPPSFKVHKEVIMILSNETEMRLAIQRTLEACGYPVVTAETQEQADAFFGSFDGAIRLLITDISLNRKNSLDVIASLRKNNQRLRVIVVCEKVSPRQRFDIHIAGVIELIYKPVEREELLRVVRRMV
jgi:DNA-binding response OmpR family regulator